MENIGKDIFDSKEPEKTGDSEIVKKKKKKISSKMPLPVEKDLSKTEKKEKDKKEPELPEEAESSIDKYEFHDGDILSDIHEEDEQELESVSGSDDEYLGELVIDHSNEVIDDAYQRGQESSESLDIVFDNNLANPDGSEVNYADLHTQEGLADDLKSFEPIESFVPWEGGISSSQPELKPNLEVLRADNILSPKSEIDPEVHSFDSNLGMNMINPSTEIDKNTPNTNTESSKNVSRREYYAEKKGLSRGLITGLLFGWLLGRRSKEKPNKTEFTEKQGSYISSEDMVVAKEALSKRVGILERTQQELQSALDISIENKDKLTDKLSELSSRTVRSREVPDQTLYEIAKKENKEAAKSIEDYIVEADVESDSNKTNNRVETSAWHRIEIDNKTGKLAEVPSLEYGEAFVREQQQEKLARHAATAQTANQLGSALFSSSSPLYSSSESSVKTTEKKSITFISSNDIGYVVYKIAKNTTNPSVWAVALLLVIFIIVTGII